MTNPKFIYIAGPMRGHINLNFDAFDRAEAYLLRKGYLPINPAGLDRIEEGYGKHPPKEDGFTLDEIKKYLMRDIEWIMRLEPPHDGIYMLSGWQTSKGAKTERALAKYLGLNIMYQSPQDEVYYNGY